MSDPASRGGRLRAYLQFLVAILYFFLARSLAFHGARGLVTEAWSELGEQIMLVFLLLLGYAAMGFWFDHQTLPIEEQGLPLRGGWKREIALGSAVGWAIALVCVLPMALIGGIATSFSIHLSSWGWLVADAAFFALTALAEEVAFRGYGFQNLIRSLGPFGATLFYTVIYAILQALTPGASRASFAVALVFSFLLSAAYLRTRALWVSWGLNFGWKASRALVFGLAVSDVSSRSPVVQGDPMGPFWLTGGAYGLDGSWFAFLILVVTVPVLYRVTRDLNFRYNAPVIVPGGIPVDLDALARAQHETAPEQTATPLVQIETPPMPDGSGEQGTTKTESR